MVEDIKNIQSIRINTMHWSVFFTSIVLTLAAWQWSKIHVEQSMREQFVHAQMQVIELVKERLALYETALLSARSFVNVKGGSVEYPQWLKYAKDLHIETTYPGINGIGVIFNVQPENLDSFLALQRKYNPYFRIHPAHMHAEYWPITFVEPKELNIAAVGLDMAFENNRYAGILAARETGKSQITKPIALVQDAQQTPGFLFFAPFYKNGENSEFAASRKSQVMGMIYAPFIMHKLMEGTLSGQNRLVSIHIQDGGQTLFNDREYDIGAYIDPDPLFQKTSFAKMYGRNWEFMIASNLKFRNAYASNEPMFILAGGIIIDLLIFFVIFSLSRINKKAFAYAKIMTRELQEKTHALEKSNKDLEQFSYIASHDLKSPLNAITKISSWIEEDCRDLLPEESKQHLNLLIKRSDRMQKLLTDLLDYSRIGQVCYEPEEIHLKVFIDDILMLIDCPDKFSIVLEDAVLNLPRVPLEIVMRNLISNAIKHHDHPDGKIEISHKITPKFYEIYIQDNGPGIAPEFREKVFQMFQTLKPRDKVEGSGMGLAVCKKIVEHYRGQLTIEDNSMPGTFVKIVWPIAIGES